MRSDNPTVTRTALAVLLCVAWNPLWGQVDNDIPNCPPTPNCVTSAPGADDGHHVLPLRFEGSAETAWETLRKALKSQGRLTIVEDTNDHIRAEVTSTVFRFVDDVEFWLDPEKRLIHVRSASRVGYWDFGVNRRRIESLREQLANGKD